MSSGFISPSDRIYRALLRLFPGDFRSEFESEMEQAFREQREGIERRRGKAGLFRLWGETIAGIFTTAPAEHLAMLRQDIQYALRMMRKNPSFTAVAVLTLALGIGANTAIVSVIDAVLLKPLPYRHGDQLVMLHQRAEKVGLAGVGYSAAEVQDYRRQNGSLSDLVEFHSMSFTLLSKNEATRVRTGVVSDGFFRVFGVKPILGRDFTSADDQPGAPAVLLLSYEYWKTHENSDPNIVGKTYRMNDRVHTVIGVLPPVPQYPSENDVYMPTTACPFRSNPKTVANRNARMVSLFGRLKPGVSVDHCQSDLAVIAARLEKQYPEAYPKELGFTSTAVSLRKEITDDAKPMLLVLLGAAGCVLLIACANVANLMLARMSGRERELMVRSALGAGQGRLLRQLFTESFLMALLAAAFGVLFASQSLKLLVDFTARLTPRAREIQVDGHMLLFALAAAFLTSIVAGSVAAIRPRNNFTPGLKDGGCNFSMDRRRVTARNALVVCQVAFSFVLLIGAGLMLRSFFKLRSVDPGFVPQRVLAMKVSLNWSKYSQGEHVLDLTDRLLSRLRQLPGVLSVAASSSYPLDADAMRFGGWNQRITIEGRPENGSERPPLTEVRSASVDYFKTLGIPLVEGRIFERSDNEHAPKVAIVNQTMARHYFQGSSPIGRRISNDGGESWVTVVGVVADVKELGLDRDTADELYLAHTQAPGLGSVLVRTQQDGIGLADDMRGALRSLDPEIAVPNVVTLEQAEHEAIASPRVMTDLLAIFAALALTIAAAGIGGILALTVNQRIHEIGIRVALGAKPGRVLSMIIGRGMGLVAIGLGIGLAASFAFTRMIKALLFQIEPTDPVTFAGVSVVLAAAALVACYVPARRALRIDPLVVLRQE